jgi:hypothetical protein
MIKIIGLAQVVMVGNVYLISNQRSKNSVLDVNLNFGNIKEMFEFLGLVRQEEASI